MPPVVGVLPALHVIVVRVNRHESAERRRRLCLIRLLHELEQAGAGQIYLESRETRQNDRDLQLLAALRAQRTISSAVRMDHRTGPSEPLLWLPDLVAGAVGADRRGDPTYVDLFTGLMSYYEA